MQGAGRVKVSDHRPTRPSTASTSRVQARPVGIQTKALGWPASRQGGDRGRRQERARVEDQSQEVLFWVLNGVRTMYSMRGVGKHPRDDRLMPGTEGGRTRAIQQKVALGGRLVTTIGTSRVLVRVPLSFGRRGQEASCDAQTQHTLVLGRAGTQDVRRVLGQWGGSESKPIAVCHSLPHQAAPRAFDCLAYVLAACRIQVMQSPLKLAQ